MLFSELCRTGEIDRNKRLNLSFTVNRGTEISAMAVEDDKVSSRVVKVVYVFVQDREYNGYEMVFSDLDKYKQSIILAILSQFFVLIFLPYSLIEDVYNPVFNLLKVISI